MQKTTIKNIPKITKWQRYTSTVLLSGLIGGYAVYDSAHAKADQEFAQISKRLEANKPRKNWISISMDNLDETMAELFVNYKRERSEKFIEAAKSFAKKYEKAETTEIAEIKWRVLYDVIKEQGIEVLDIEQKDFLNKEIKWQQNRFESGNLILWLTINDTLNELPKSKDAEIQAYLSRHVQEERIVRNKYADGLVTHDKKNETGVKGGFIFATLALLAISIKELLEKIKKKRSKIQQVSKVEEKDEITRTTARKTSMELKEEFAPTERTPEALKAIKDPKARKKKLEQLIAKARENLTQILGAQTSEIIFNLLNKQGRISARLAEK